MGQRGKGLYHSFGHSPTLHDFHELVLLQPFALQELSRFMLRVESKQDGVIPSIWWNQSPQLQFVGGWLPGPDGMFGGEFGIKLHNTSERKNLAYDDGRVGPVQRRARHSTFLYHELVRYNVLHKYCQMV